MAEARAIIEKHEYLGSMPVASHAFGLFFNDRIGAVAVFSPEYAENFNTWSRYGPAPEQITFLFRTNQLAGGLEPATDRQFGPSVDRLRCAVPLPEPIGERIRIADRDVAAAFQSMRNNTAVSAVLKPCCEAIAVLPAVGIRTGDITGLVGDANQRGGFGVAHLVEHVRKLGVLWGAAGLWRSPG
jgi:hypothetical protein